mgnify:CR=1 FL=1
MILIIVGIVVLIGGYYFIKSFDKIDAHFFGSTSPDYEPFGLVLVILSALGGAIATGSSLANELFNLDIDTDSVVNTTCFGVIILIAFGFYISCMRMGNWGARIGKFCFLMIACLLGAGTGAIGSVVIICGIILYLLLIVFGTLLGGGGSSKKKYILDDGTEVTKNAGLLGDDNYYDKQGSRWNRSGDTFTKK